MQKRQLVNGQISFLPIGDCAGCRRPLDALTEDAHPVWIRPFLGPVWDWYRKDRQVGDLEQVPVCERCFNDEWGTVVYGAEVVAFHVHRHLVIPELEERRQDLDDRARAAAGKAGKGIRPRKGVK